MYTYKECSYQKVLHSPLKTSGFVPENGSEIFVRNIPRDAVNIYELAEFFSVVSNIFQIKLMLGKDKQHNRGYGYVTYMNSSAAKQAQQQLKNKLFRNNCLLVIEPSLNNCRIFLGGIPTTKTKNEVWQELVKKGVKDIVDVIMYRSYCDRAENRGFVFVEFRTHEQAALFRAKYARRLFLFQKPVVIDWSIPIPDADESVMAQVSNIYIRNLDCCFSIQDFRKLLYTLIQPDKLQKVYRFKNYAFVHLYTREDAEILFDQLKETFKETSVEVHWAKPPNKFTSPEYRRHQLSSLSKTCRSRNNSSSSSFSSSPPPTLSNSSLPINNWQRLSSPSWRSEARSSVSLSPPIPCQKSLEASNAYTPCSSFLTPLANLDVDERPALETSVFNNRTSCTCSSENIFRSKTSNIIPRSDCDFLQNAQEENFSTFSSGLNASLDSASFKTVTSRGLDNAALIDISSGERSLSGFGPSLPLGTNVTQNPLRYMLQTLNLEKPVHNSAADVSLPTSRSRSTPSDSAAPSRLSRLYSGQFDLGWFPVAEDALYSNNYFSYQ